MANKLNVIACGGGGINIADAVISNVAELGEGFCDVNIHYLDTSRNNIDKIGYTGSQFTLVKTASFGKSNIDGSGGERSTNSKEIAETVKLFLDKNNYTKPVTNEYTIVLSSVSGGTGSVILPIIVKLLMERNIPVLPVITGDSSNALNTNNTLKSLKGLYGLATKTFKKPLSVVYVNNTSMGENDNHSAEVAANKRIFNTLGTMSMFLSGENGDVDTQDMINFVDQSNYKSIDIKPGLYGLVTHSGNIVPPNDAIPTVARTLTIDGIPPVTGVTLLHNKIGICLKENAKNIYEGQFPIHAVNYANYLTVEIDHLTKIKANYDNIMDSIKINEVELEAEEDADENGLIF